MQIEREAKSEEMSKKLWKLVRVVLIMVKKGLAKSKLILDVALLLKRSHKLAGKTLHSLILSSSSSNDVVGDYEFSCSSSPASFSFLTKRNKSSPSLLSLSRRTNDEANTMAAVQRVLEMINHEEPGSPPVRPRQLRVTDSPFPVKDNEEEAVQVSKAADDFINKFYSNLRMQKSMAC